MTQHTETGTDHPGRQQRAAPRVTAKAVRILIVVLAVLLLAAAAVAGWFAIQERRSDQEAKDRAAAVAVATQLALRVDTFDGKDFDAYSKSIQSLLTTKYKGEFEEQFAPFRQAFTQSGATSTGKVLASGVGSFDPDSATVLVVHDSTVTSRDSKIDRRQRWTVDLVKVDAKWLVDDFTLVG